MRSIFLFLMLGFGVIGNAQPNPKLPDVLPPSPEAAAITKNNELNVGGYNGAVSTSIPLYQVNGNDFSLPVSINYSSNGLKVDEIPSRAGLGWNLNAGGVVTRIVNGKPDDLTTRFYPTVSLGTTLSAIEYYYDLDDESHYYDAEPDEFRISAPGLSGKFVLDTNNNAVLIPHSNLKVQVNRLSSGGPYQEVIITNTEGIEYYFGGAGAVEYTTNHNLSGKLSSFSEIASGFFLRKIVFLNKDSINFYYSTIAIRNITGVTHTAVEAAGLFSGLDYCSSTNASCPSGSPTFSESISDIHYNALLLDSIKNFNGNKIAFSYSNRSDSSGDKKLTGIAIGEGTATKKYGLTFYDPVSYGQNDFSDYNKRFFLKELKYWSEKEGNVSDTLRHKFDYINLNGLPGRLSYSQDEYGYYNGKYNQNLLPKNSGSGTYGGYALADRTPDIEYAQIGMLSKIIYPTGGSDSIIYKADTYKTYELVQYPAHLEEGGQGSGASTIVTFTSSTFTTQRSNQAQLNIVAGISPSCSSCVAPETGVDIIVDVYLKNLTDATQTRRIIRDFTSTSEILTLAGSKTYQLEVKVRGDYVAGFAELWYDNASSNTYDTVTHQRPGVFLGHIISRDSATSIANHKYFKYASVGNLNTSSGLPLYGLTYETNAYVASLNCDGFSNDRVCVSNVISSNSNVTQYYYDNNAFVFSSILESNDSSFKNGVVEHVYEAEALTGTYSTIIGDDLFQMPGNTYTWNHGYELATNFYDSTLRLVKSINNYYHIDTAVNRYVRGIAIRSKYWYPEPSGSVGQQHIDPWDVGEYNYNSRWIQVDSTVTTEYDIMNHLISSKTTFFYGSLNNVLPIRTESYDSKGYLVKVEKKYPTDYPSTAPYQRMVDKNIITPVIEDKLTRNSNLISTVTNNFYDFSANQSSGYPILIKPQTINTKKGSGSSETRIRFGKYDAKGNYAEIAKENDIRINYIWDYDGRYPIAEVQNSDSANVAYTSFESDGKGRWVFSGSVNSTYAITGTKSYLISNGDITKSGLTSAAYIVSYWKKNGTVMVNSGAATRTGKTIGDWTYYEHEVSTTSITVSGNAYIDELRLYPKTAMMTSSTYIPLVGISSKSDQAGRITFYEYDIFNRLKAVKDEDGKILKLAEYKYNGTYTD